MDERKGEAEFRINGDEAVASSTSIVIRTLDELLSAAEVDLDVWYVDRWLPNAWGQHSVKKGYVTLYQVKAWLKRKIPAVTELLVQSLFDELKTLAPHYPEIPERAASREAAHSLEISIFDLHFGKYAWRDETGESYNMEIAEQLFLWAAEHLLSQARDYEIEEIIFPLGNDLFNADNVFGTTTAGTPQDMIGQYLEHLKRVNRMARAAIDQMAALAPVHVYIIPGNHDLHTMFGLGLALDAWYHHNDRVQIHLSPQARMYHRFGKNLIGFTHGKSLQPDKLPLLMAAEEPTMWADTEYREWHIGHKHHKKEFRYLPVDEVKGIRVRVLPSLTATDSWHYRNGYVKGIRSAEAYLWHKEFGMIAQFSANVGAAQRAQLEKLSR